MWQRNKNRRRVDLDFVRAAPSFRDQFFSQSLHQKFNRKGFEFLSDENESAIIKYARLLIANETK